MPADYLARYLEKRTRRRFAAVVRAHRDDVLNAAYRVLGDRGLAEDVTQEVFLKLLSAKWTASEVRCGRALLVSQAFRSALALRRSEARRTERERKFAEMKGSAAQDPQALIEVRDAVLGLPEDLRTCVELRYFGGLLVEEVAVAAGLSRSSIKSRLKEAREILRVKLAPLASALLFPLLADEASSSYPVIEASRELDSKLGEMAREGPLLARIAAGEPRRLISGKAALFLLAAAGTVAGGILIGSRPDGQGDGAGSGEPAAPAPIVSAPAPPEPALLAAADKDDQAPVPAVAAEPPETQGKPYRVTGEAGEPIPGVQVALCRRLLRLDEEVPAVGRVVELNGNHWGRYWIIDTETGVDGGFDFPEEALAMIESGASRSHSQVFILAKKDGYYPHGSVIHFRPPRGYGIVLQPAGEARIRVLSQETGAPVTRYLLLYDPGSSSVFQASPLRGEPFEVEVDDPEGAHSFAAPHPEWHHHVEVAAAGYPPHPGKAFPVVDGELVIHLSRPAAIRGIVTDPSGTPVEGAQVYAANRRIQLILRMLKSRYEASGGDAMGRKVLTAADGSFSIEPLETETWLAALHESSTPAVLKVPSPTPPVPIGLVLGRGGAVWIRRLDAEGRPVEGEKMELHHLELDEEPHPALVGIQSAQSLAIRIENRLRGTTDGDGEARFEGLLPGWYLWLERRDRFQVHAERATELMDQDPLPDAPEPPGRARVTGRIQIGGRPVQGGIYIAGLSTKLDPDGRFLLEGLRPGAYKVQFPPYPGVSPTIAGGAPFEVPAGALSVEVDWDFPLCELRGKVATAGGVIPSGLKCELLAVMDTANPRMRSFTLPAGPIPIDERGSFTHRYLTTGRCALEVRAKGFRTERKLLEVGNGTPTTIELPITLEPSRSVLRLHVRDAVDGKPLMPGQVSFVRHDGDALIQPDSRPTEASEPLEWSGLPAGVYDYGVTGGGFVFDAPHGFAYGSVSVDGESSVDEEVAIPPGGSLLVEVKDGSGRRFAEPLPVVEVSRPDGKPAAAPIGLYLHEDIRVWAATCEKPGAYFANLPVGNYEVKATKDGFSGARDLVQVEAGKLARVALTLSR